MKKIYVNKSIKVDGLSTYYDRTINHNCFIEINEQINNYFLKFLINEQVLKTGEIQGFREFEIQFYKKDLKEIKNIIENEKNILEIDFSNLYLNEYQVLKNDFNNLEYIRELQKKAKKELIINGKIIKFRKIVNLNKFTKEITL